MLGLIQMFFFFFFFFCYLVVILGIELRASSFDHLNHAPSPFAFSLFFRQGLSLSPWPASTFAFHIAGITDMCHYA
jgi:hypothetical protein